VSLDNVKAVVLAAGKGVRMKSERPKVLHEILGRPVLDFVLRNLRLAGVQDIIVVVGHQAEKVKAAAKDCRFAEQTIQKGTGHALLAAEPLLKGFSGDIFVVAGDAPLIGPDTLRRLYEDHRAQKRDATFLSACLDDPTGYGRVVRDRSSGRFQRFAEESDATPEEKNIPECNSGTYLFKAPAILEALRDVTPNNSKGELYLTDALGVLVGKGRAVDAVRSLVPTEIYGINSRRDLVAATNFIRWKILEYHMDNGVSVVDPSTTFIEEDVTIGQDTVIQPFSVIRRGVVIGKNCEVGPFTQLRAGTVMEDGAEVGNFVEVKKSRIGSHSKAKHLTYLGDATLGAHVNIGAGTITANYDGKNKNPTVIGDHSHTGSNTVLVAPVKLGRNVTTGAGAVVVKGEIPDDAVLVGVPARPLPPKNGSSPKAKTSKKPLAKAGRKRS
jgi:bifunctional UDP-N-acetylglucosamine pyrophosphorylase/glucosamine-1-phosphate N-acetyltransferase